MPKKRWDWHPLKGVKEIKKIFLFLFLVLCLTPANYLYAQSDPENVTISIARIPGGGLKAVVTDSKETKDYSMNKCEETLSPYQSVSEQTSGTPSPGGTTSPATGPLGTPTGTAVAGTGTGGTAVGTGTATGGATGTPTGGGAGTATGTSTMGGPTGTGGGGTGPGTGNGNGGGPGGPGGGPNGGEGDREKEAQPIEKEKVEPRFTVNVEQGMNTEGEPYKDLVIKFPNGDSVHYLPIHKCLIPKIPKEGMTWVIRDDTTGGDIEFGYNERAGEFPVVGADGVKRKYKIGIAEPEEVNRKGGDWISVLSFGSDEEGLPKSTLVIPYKYDPNCSVPVIPTYRFNLKPGESIKDYDLDAAVVAPRDEKGKPKQLTYRLGEVSVELIFPPELATDKLDEELRKSIQLTPEGKLTIKIPENIELGADGVIIFFVNYDVETPDGKKSQAIFRVFIP